MLGAYAFSDNTYSHAMDHKYDVQKIQTSTYVCMLRIYVSGGKKLTCAKSPIKFSTRLLAYIPKVGK